VGRQAACVNSILLPDPKIDKSKKSILFRKISRAPSFSVSNESLDSDKHAHITEIITSFFARSSEWLWLNKSKKSHTYEKCDKKPNFAHKMTRFSIICLIKLLRFLTPHHLVRLWAWAVFYRKNRIWHRADITTKRGNILRIRCYAWVRNLEGHASTSMHCILTVVLCCKT